MEIRKIIYTTNAIDKFELGPRDIPRADRIHQWLDYTEGSVSGYYTWICNIFELCQQIKDIADKELRTGDR